MRLTVSTRGIFPAAILFAVGGVFLLQVLGAPHLGSLLFIALGLAFATPHFFSVERRRHVFLLPAGVLLGMGTGLLVPALVGPASSVGASIFLASLGAGVAGVSILAPERRWPLIPAALLFLLAAIEFFAQTSLVPEPIRSFIVPLILFAMGAYIVVEPAMKGQ